jgi:hypothetical protein
MQGKVCRFLATWLKGVSTKTYVTMGSVGLGVSFVKRESFLGNMIAEMKSATYWGTRSESPTERSRQAFQGEPQMRRVLI